MNARIEDRQLEQPRRHVRDVRALARSGPTVDARVEIDEEERDHERGDERRPCAPDRERDEARDAEARDRQQALGHARKAKRGERVPERRVQRQPRPDGEQNRHERSQCEDERQPEPPPAHEHHEPGDRD